MKKNYIHNKQTKWVKIVERRGQSVLISSYFYNGLQTKYFKKILGLKNGLDYYLIVNYSNYYLDTEVKRFQKMIDNIFQSIGYTYFRIALNKLKFKGQKLIYFAQKASRIKYHNYKIALAVFKKFSKLCLEFAPAMYFPILIEKLIEAKTKTIINKHIKNAPKNIFSLLTSSTIPTEGTKELISLYSIAAKYFYNEKKVNNNIRRMIQRHLMQFGWLSFTKFVGDPWDYYSIISRLERLDAVSINNELNELRSKYSKLKRKILTIIKQYKFTKEEASFLKDVQFLAYFRTFRIDAYTKAGFHMKPLFEFMAKNMGLSLLEFVCLTYEEIQKYSKNKKDYYKMITQKRLNQPWQLLFSKGKMFFDYNTPHFLADETKSFKGSIIKGQTASVGFVRGVVKIIRGVLEFKKMIDDAVLVTSMTTPDFVPLMQRASAIVTDEGGITCHAAIVSRELKKPCIIGTKNATSILRDGDLVEVDANKGVVKILKRASK